MVHDKRLHDTLQCLQLNQITAELAGLDEEGVRALATAYNENEDGGGKPNEVGRDDDGS